MPELQENGRFNRDLLRRILESQRDRGEFEESIRRDIRVQRLQNLVTDGIQVTAAEVEERYKLDREQVNLAFVRTSAADLAKTATVTDQEIEAELKAHPERYRTPATVRARYVAYRRGDFEALAKPTPEQVQKFYDEHVGDRFTAVEEVRARHILVRVDPGADAAAKQKARTEAEGLLKQVKAGGDFEALAKKHSKDPGSAAKGGDLGFFPRGRMVPAFEAAAFSLEPGKVSDPIQSTYGFHIIRVEEKRPAKVISFDEAKASLAREILAEERAKKDADELVAKLLEAIGSGKTLVEAARERSVSIERPGPVRRRGDGVIPSLGSSKEALAAIFALTAEKPTTDRAFEVSGKRVLFERTGGKLPTEAELAPNLKMARDQLLEQRRTELSNAWIETRRKELEAEGRLVYNYARNEPPPE
jgi:peptidyl-prolyl cis-trans isomerase D